MKAAIVVASIEGACGISAPTTPNSTPTATSSAVRPYPTDMLSLSFYRKNKKREMWMATERKSMQTCSGSTSTTYRTCRRAAGSEQLCAPPSLSLPLVSPSLASRAFKALAAAAAAITVRFVATTPRGRRPLRLCLSIICHPEHNVSEAVYFSTHDENFRGGERREERKRREEKDDGVLLFPSLSTPTLQLVHLSIPCHIHQSIYFPSIHRNFGRERERERESVRACVCCAVGCWGSSSIYLATRGRDVLFS